MDKEMVYLLSIVVDQKPSRMDDEIRGKISFKSFSGSYSSREDVTEEYPILASSRDEAIAIFRSCTGWSGRIDSVEKLNTFGKIEDSVEKSKRGNRRRAAELEGEFSKISDFIKGD